MKAGQSVVLEIPFTGCPQPKATWRLNGEPVHDSRRIKVDTIYNMASLSIGRAEFDDAGEYSLVLDNIHGNVRLNIKVIVLGRTRRVYHFNFAAPTEWNRLDKRIRSISNLNTFKSDIKTILFLNYFDV